MTVRCRWCSRPVADGQVWCQRDGCHDAHVAALGQADAYHGPVVLEDGDGDPFGLTRVDFPGAWLDAARVLAACLGDDPDQVVLRPEEGGQKTFTYPPGAGPPGGQLRGKPGGTRPSRL